MLHATAPAALVHAGLVGRRIRPGRPVPVVPVLAPPAGGGAAVTTAGAARARALALRSRAIVMDAHGIARVRVGCRAPAPQQCAGGRAACRRPAP